MIQLMHNWVVPSPLPPIEVLDKVGSTNALLMERGRSGAVHGAAVRARVQTAGRGRRAHGWSSPKGGLYLSVLVRPHAAAGQLPGLPVACALGIVDALHSVGCLQAKLKWPNDVVVGRAKLAGILTELGQRDTGSFAVCGVGVNVSEPEEGATMPGALVPVGLATSLNVGCTLPSLDELAECVRTGILSAVESWERGLAGCGENTAPLFGIVDAYNERLAFRGERVSVFAIDGARVFDGTLLGVDEEGHALVRDDVGCNRVLDASRVSIRPVE